MHQRRTTTLSQTTPSPPPLSPSPQLPTAISSRHQPLAPSALKPPRPRHALAASVVSSDDGGIDSPTYDGDIESSATLGQGRDTPSSSAHYPSSAASTLTSPAPSASPSLHPVDAPLLPHSSTDALAHARTYRINPPPTGRPVRIYADGVYDLFHFGHALQLRQAKLAFPDSRAPDAPHGVYLLVGVNSDEQCAEHKNCPIMTHPERCEAVRHCRWVDEVVPTAPWVIDGAFIDKYRIDYVAHDEDPYVSSGHDDVYAFAKSQGKFLPTRRTAGVSTSDLLERIVSGYRQRVFDKKLARMGHAELMAEGSDYDDSAPSSGHASRRASP
ncbi:Choline-phosphate cytidylyltransferase 1 [Grifola frondosa]|uniref:choline-phosphate cytidylyltransferase n=1 Tax=Grifola frondosa TaxID=5627 RepID=A0A1C7MDG6_GRIFR|nr:Choline-phosphate cytidylyltransferase 1 [Grifola frondosa]